jgi:plastocyanin
MRLRRSVLAIAVVSAILAGSSLFGCSKAASPTSPYGGGSTGGGGTPPGGASFDSGTLTAPATYVRVFPTAGTVGYHCTFHVSMGMIGTVTVVSGAADSAVVSASGTSFTPLSVNIKPGGQVRWNVTGGTHTVTSD